MISRTWHGIVPIKHKEGLTKYEYENRCKRYFENRGKRYAGDTPEIAVTYPEDAQYELISGPIVIIQEVTSDVNPLD